MANEHDAHLTEPYRLLLVAIRSLGDDDLRALTDLANLLAATAPTEPCPPPELEDGTRVLSVGDLIPDAAPTVPGAHDMGDR